MLDVTTPPSGALNLFIMFLIWSWFVAWGWTLYRAINGRPILPDARPRLVPWGANSVLAVLLIWVVLQALIPPIYLGLAGAERPAVGGKFKVTPRDQILLSMAINLPLVVVSAALLARTSGATAGDFGIDRRRVVPDLVLGVLSWAILAPVVFGVNMVVLRIYGGRVRHPIEDWAVTSSSAWTWLLIAGSTAVATPIAEEFLFRGVLLGWLDRLAIGRARESTRLLAANVLVSIVFAAMHGPVWPSPVPIFFLSIGLGVLYQRTGGLIAPIALHATFNGVSTMLLYLSGPAGPVPIS